MFDAIGKLVPQLRSKAWASPGQGQSLLELEVQLRASGNQILEVDSENTRILIAVGEETGEPAWGCRICLAEGTLVIVDTEQELVAHCDENHEGWRDK